MVIVICGRKVKIATSGKSQTVNVCSARNAMGEYDLIVRMHSPNYVTGDELGRQNFTSLDALAVYLQQKRHGVVEKHVPSTASLPTTVASPPEDRVYGTPPGTASTAVNPPTHPARARPAESRILILATSPEQWRAFLANPEAQWKTGYSAKALAYCWQEANGLPESVARVFRQSGQDIFLDFELLLALPEHKVALPGGVHGSQSDLWVLGRGAGQLVSIVVEGKAAESFGLTVGQWLQGASPGKKERLEYLCAKLGLPYPPLPTLRYQLLHRTVSAVLEAERFNAPYAMMLVHSFSPADDSLDDYRHFLSQFGVSGGPGEVVSVGQRCGISLYMAWVRGEESCLTR